LRAAKRTALVMQLRAKEEPAARVARRVSASETSLYSQRELFLEVGAAGVAGSGRPAGSKA
jgi:hypothetical protein